MLEVPGSEHPIWRRMVTGELKVNCDFLATKVLLIRIMVEIGEDPSGELIDSRANELRTLFVKNVRNPRVQNDLKRLLAGAV